MAIHEDSGHGHDQKYSLWRRNIFPKLSQSRNCYCSDIDWVEWRNGKPVALLECRRAIGALKTSEDILEHFKSLNNGFQLELYTRLSYGLGIPVFLVAIVDEAPDEKDYLRATFTVSQIIPPKTWPTGRINLQMIKIIEIGIFDEAGYVSFILRL